MGMTFAAFTRLSLMLVVIGDLITALLVLDCMLQDRLEYPHWLKHSRKFYCEGMDGYFRVYCFWLCLFAVLLIVPIGFYMTDSNGSWDNKLGGSDEVWRCALAALIFSLDFMIVLQDWEFPEFT